MLKIKMLITTLINSEEGLNCMDGFIRISLEGSLSCGRSV